MFHYEQNTNLTAVHQQARLEEAKRSRLAADDKPRTHRFGAVFAYALRKSTAMGQMFQIRGQKATASPTATQEVAFVP